MRTEKDQILLSQKGITENELNEQLACFRRGFPYLQIAAPASIERGILRVSEEAKADYMDAWNSYLSLDKVIVKFVPASGAASRMFKDLFSFVESDRTEPTTESELQFFEELSQFAFYKSLSVKCEENEGKNIEQLLLDKKYKIIVGNLLLSKGLDYGGLPKGLLEFHRYSDDMVRTPFEEHMEEGRMYACNSKNEVAVHFTISREHREFFERLAARIQSESHSDVVYKVSFSEQKPSTDTVAVDMDNNLFREANGDLVFRPGGHGALIENLNDIDADIVFVKNIDNVSPDRDKPVEVEYKRLIAGVLVQVQRKIFEYLKLIDSTKYTHDDLLDMLHFIKKALNVYHTEVKHLEDSELALYIKRKLDRPIRVCGMVANVGEPGGGPFLVSSGDGTISPQILESSQIDMDDEAARAMFVQGTHFNPVDLVCGIKDYRGRNFNLKDYIDINAGFISVKSKGGKELKALELPGLWNGAMSDWNTIFVEVPIETFTPVKTVNDLLREEHRACM